MARKTVTLTYGTETKQFEIDEAFLAGEPIAPRNGNDAQDFAATCARALGIQRISLCGVPPTSHFARVLAAADYRMKRLAMNFEPAPVEGLPSYLAMIEPGAPGSQAPWAQEPKPSTTMRYCVPAVTARCSSEE